MTFEEKRMINQLIWNGCTTKRITSEYQISESTIRRIIRVLNNHDIINRPQAKTNTKKLLRYEAVKDIIYVFRKHNYSHYFIRNSKSLFLINLESMLLFIRPQTILSVVWGWAIKRGKSRPIDGWSWKDWYVQVFLRKYIRSILDTFYIVFIKIFL